MPPRKVSSGTMRRCCRTSLGEVSLQILDLVLAAHKEWHPLVHLCKITMHSVVCNVDCVAKSEKYSMVMRRI